MSKENGGPIACVADRVIPLVELPDCSDKDEDCLGLPNKVKCYLYDPQRGMCPFLRAERSKP